MTCDNIDSDATVFAQNCIIFVHYAMLCLEFISVCMYACMHVCMCDSCMFILHASSVCILHAVHSHSCICLLRSVACILGVIAYILLYMRSLPSTSSSTVMYLVQLLHWCRVEVNFDTSLSLLMSLGSFCT